MTDINNLTVIGRITRDLNESSYGYTNNGTARANISIAVNRSRKNGDQWVDDVSYFDVTIWGKTAENLKPYLVKGQQIAVQGYLKQDRWEKDGEKKSRVVIVSELVQLVGGKREETQDSQFSSSQNSNPVFKPIPGNAEAYEDSAMPEDIPF